MSGFFGVIICLMAGVSYLFSLIDQKTAVMVWGVGAIITAILSKGDEE